MEGAPPSAVFFGGASWGCIYHMGVYDGLVSRFGADALRCSTVWGGTSSGALVALSAALGWTPAEVRGIYDELAALARAYGVFGKMSIYHALVLARALPDGGGEWENLLGRLHVGVTVGLARFELVSTWRSNAELRDIMHASMHIPFYMNHIACFGDRRRALDGGFSQNLAAPLAGRPTVTVCCFSRGATLRPPPGALYGLFSHCFAPMSPQRCDAAAAAAREDTRVADLTVDLGAPLCTPLRSRGLCDGLPAVLLGGPLLPRAALQFVVCVGGWGLRWAEEIPTMLVVLASAGGAFWMRARLRG